MLDVSFRVIPVLDVQGGQVVHARGGDRREYRPFVSSVVSNDPDPTAVAAKLRDRFGFGEIYLADLDAIGSGSASSAVLPRLLDLGMNVVADLGIKTRRDVPSLPRSRADVSLVLATETLGGPAALKELVHAEPSGRFVFGLDLRDGKPLVAPGHDWEETTPGALVRTAVEAGITRVLLLDLAKVGTGAGTGLFPLAERLLLENDEVQILVGGGIAGIDEILRWKAAGISGVLVGSALHDGRLTPADLARLDS